MVAGCAGLCVEITSNSLCSALWAENNSFFKDMLVREKLEHEGLDQFSFLRRTKMKLFGVVHIFNLSTPEAEAGKSLSSRPAWPT